MLAALRSVAAVVGGIAVFSLLLVAAAAVGRALFGLSESELINYSPVAQGLWVMWNIASMAAAGYVTAAIVLRAPVAHAVVMATIQTLFTLGAMFTSRQDITPVWVWIAGLVVTIPAGWVGAVARRSRLTQVADG